MIRSVAIDVNCQSGIYASCWRAASLPVHLSHNPDNLNGANSLKHGILDRPHRSLLSQTPSSRTDKALAVKLPAKNDQIGILALLLALRAISRFPKADATRCDQRPGSTIILGSLDFQPA
jgi:hypothetical protein